MHAEYQPGMYIPAVNPNTGAPIDLEAIAETLQGLGIPRVILEPAYDIPPIDSSEYGGLSAYDFQTEGSLGYIGYDALKGYFEIEAPDLNSGMYTKIWNRLGHVNSESEDPIIYMRSRNEATGRVDPKPLVGSLYNAKDVTKSDLFVSADALYILMAAEDIGGPKTGVVLKKFLNQRIERHRELCPRTR